MARATGSLMLGTVSGKVGNAVFVRAASGRTYVRSLPQQSGVVSPKQAAMRERLKRSVAAWRSMSVPQAEAWREYAASSVPLDPRRRSQTPPQAYNAFTALAVKFQQANPGLPIPLDPPSGPFLGDAVRVSAQAVPGHLMFDADQANAEGVLTELLIQPLATAHRRPNPNGYRSAAFVAFAPGSLGFSLPLPPGPHAWAFRFVRAATGQETDLVVGGVAVAAAVRLAA